MYFIQKYVFMSITIGHGSVASPTVAALHCSKSMTSMIVPYPTAETHLMSFRVAAAELSQSYSVLVEAHLPPHYHQ